MSTTARVTHSLLSAPLPQIIERLGISIAEAQAALDKNSVKIAGEMVKTKVEIGESEYNLIALGFTPTFYAFTEATVEAKLSFTMTESSEFGISVGAQAGGFAGPVMFAASVDVSYARKFSVSAEGSSSIAARIVSLPAPDILTEILRREAGAVPNPDT
jgi:hypothetical protein